MIFAHRQLYQSAQYSISNSLQWETTQLYIAIRERVVTFQSHPKYIIIINDDNTLINIIH